MPLSSRSNLHAAGGKLLEREWSDNGFRWIRHQGGLALTIEVLVAAEVIAMAYYAALRQATACPVLRALCRQVLEDEVLHLEFQGQVLGRLEQRASPGSNASSRAVVDGRCGSAVASCGSHTGRCFDRRAGTGRIIGSDSHVTAMASNGSSPGRRPRVERLRAMAPAWREPRGLACHVFIGRRLRIDDGVGFRQTDRLTFCGVPEYRLLQADGPAHRACRLQ